MQGDFCIRKQRNDFLLNPNRHQSKSYHTLIRDKYVLSKPLDIIHPFMDSKECLTSN